MNHIFKDLPRSDGSIPSTARSITLVHARESVMHSIHEQSVKCACPTHASGQQNGYHLVMPPSGRAVFEAFSISPVLLFLVS